MNETPRVVRHAVAKTMHSSIFHILRVDLRRHAGVVVTATATAIARAAAAVTAIAMAMVLVASVGSAHARRESVCTDALRARAAARIARTTAGVALGCMRAMRSGKRPISESLAECIEADPSGRIARRSRHALGAEVSACGEFRGTTSSVRRSGWAAPRELAFLIEDLLGSQPESWFRSDVRSGPERACARNLARAGMARWLRRARRYATCLRRADDPAGDATACFNIAARIAPASLCSEPAVSSVPSPRCADIESTSCLPASSTCRHCRLIAVADKETIDCDVVDDGVANASCPPITLPELPSVCGDGAVEGDEQCDVGDAHSTLASLAGPASSDCCDESCLFAAPGAACADDGEACTTDVCDDVGRCAHASVCAWTFSDATASAQIDAGFLWDRTDLQNPELERRIVAGGVAAADVDGDGWTDLYFVGGPDGAARLYINDRDGTFSDTTVASGVAITGTDAAGPLFADLVGDALPDLLVVGVNDARPRLFENLGAGTFSELGESFSIDVDWSLFGAAAGDYDADGDLDVYLSGWARPLDGAGRLWRNDGGGAFVDVTMQTGLGVARSPIGFDWSFSPNFVDLDNDGFVDLLVAADFGSSQVWRNNGDGTFEDVTTDTIDDENGMGAAIADYDADGDFDWFVSSIFDPDDATGNWGTTGNRLYRNRGDATFDNVTDSAGVGDGAWGWGSCFADFNLDGYDDIFHTNGFSSDSSQPFYSDSSRLFIADGDGSFTQRSAEVGLVDSDQGRGVVCFDYDGDGDIDILVGNNEGPARLWANGADVLANHHLTVRVLGADGSTAIGARVEVLAAERRQMRTIRAGSNYASQDPALAHFGLGTAATAAEVCIVWPDGTRATYFDVTASTTLTVSPTGIAP